MKFFEKKKPVYDTYQFLTEFKKLKKVIKSCKTLDQFKCTHIFVHNWIDRIVLSKEFTHRDVNLASSLSIALIRELASKEKEIKFPDEKVQ
jgi:hypothetical protein